MLTQSSVYMASNIAEILVGKSIKLIPKNNTLINELNVAINNNMLISGYFEKEAVPTFLIHASIGKEQTVKGVKNYISSSHDAYIDNYIVDISKLASGYVSFARNVVNKEINLLTEEIQSSVSNYKYKEPEDFFSVKYYSLNEIFSSDLINTEVYSYNNNSTKFFKDNFNLNLVRAEDFDIVKCLLTGDESQDALILNWVSCVGVSDIKSYICADIAEYGLSNSVLPDYALANYLFYRSIYNGFSIDLGFNITVTKSKAASNRDYFGNMLCISLNTYKKEIRLGKLLASSDVAFSYLNDKPLEITIYEESFKLLAADGLNIEVLFGFLSTGLATTDITIEKLKENAQDYLKKWDNVRSLYLISLNNSRLSIFKQLLRSCYEVSLRRAIVSEDEEEFLKSRSGFKEETLKLANSYIDSLEVTDIDDLSKLTLDLVAKIRYRDTNAYFILKEMKEILTMNDGIEPFEAALYSTISYIVDFLIEQVDVVKS